MIRLGVAIPDNDPAIAQASRLDPNHLIGSERGFVRVRVRKSGSNVRRDNAAGFTTNVIAIAWNW